VIAVFDFLRRNFANRPIWLFLTLLLLGHLINRVLRSQHRPGPVGSAFVRLATSASLLYYVVLIAWYALVPQQSDDAEPTMSSVAWLFAIGKPVYHALDSAERYSHIYGPMAFIIPGMVLWLLGPSMAVAKSVGAGAALLGLGLTWQAVRRASDGWPTAVLACGLCVLGFLAFRNLTFWSRPEPLQLAAVGAGLFAAARMRGAPAIVCLAVSVGVLCNLKFTGPLYALPIVVLFYARAGLRPALIVVAGAALAAALPFVVFSNVSWANYLLWVRLSAQNGLRVAALKENLEWGVFVLIPVLVRLSVAVPLTSEMRLVVPALLSAMCGVIVLAAKPGAGAYHLVPFLPTIAYVFAATLGAAVTRHPGWLTPFTGTLVLLAILQQEYFFRPTLDADVTGSFRDVRAYIDRHPLERVGVGYAAPERMTFARTLTVFETGEYLLDVPALQEHQLSGVQLPQATLDALRSCAVSTWLLPIGGEPFRIRNVYPSTKHEDVFPREFIDAFHQTYRREERTRYYDVWRCRRIGS
jgi:hypothetical protein